MQHQDTPITLSERASNSFHALVAGIFGLIILAAALHVAIALA